jgi:hypothetical protein
METANAELRIYYVDGAADGGTEKKFLCFVRVVAD